ncbi:MAG: hypothetical protein V7K53_27990 [Nostoc sp.]|uniref:hypothetical protein n=1 Tax=Nostoc sp. TaxID=1180 RepID=UPI002FF6FE15
MRVRTGSYAADDSGVAASPAVRVCDRPHSPTPIPNDYHFRMTGEAVVVRLRQQAVKDAGNSGDRPLANCYKPINQLYKYQ